MDIGTAIFLMGIVGLVVWRLSTLGKRTSSRGGIYTVPPPTQAPVSPNTQTSLLVGLRSHKRLLLILGGVAGALIIIILLVMSTKDDMMKMVQGTNMPFLVAALVVIVLAVLGAMGKAGSPGKWALSIVAILAILFFLSEVLLNISYGDQAGEVRRLVQERNVQEVLAPKPSKEVASVVPVMQRVSITLTTEWSKGVRVMGDQCIQWWGENPTGYDVQASGGPMPSWKDWAEWKQMRTAGRVGDPWQFRFRAKEGTLDLEYEIRNRGQCKNS